MPGIAVKGVRPGEWDALDGQRVIGRIRGDHWFGYWATSPDGVQLAGNFTSLQEAAEQLAREQAR